MAVTVFFGSSFIERLRKYCEEDMEVPGTTIFCGKGGLRTDRMDTALLHRALKTNADIAYLQLGGNDITATSTPKDIFDRICTVVTLFLDSGIRQVYIGEILTRGNFSKAPGLTKESFDRQRKRINKSLEKKYTSNFVYFPDIKYPHDYVPDLVHLQTADKHKRERERERGFTSNQRK